MFVALKRVSRDFGLRFEMDSSRQFAQRLVNDLETIRGAGFEIETGRKRYGTKLYKIRRVEWAGSSQRRMPVSFRLPPSFAQSLHHIVGGLDLAVPDPAFAKDQDFL